MPDIAAARPSSGASIESAWGGEVHDQLEGIQSGQVSIVVSGASTGSIAVTFPRAYASAPRVLVTVMDTGGSNTRAHAWLSGVPTTTGCTIAAGRDDSTTFSATIVVSWLAIGTPA